MGQSTVSREKECHFPLGTIFDVKRYAIHDGPGIRTTIFFKGCPLRCAWCHNPEGLLAVPELMLREERCPSSCSECISACPQDALSRGEGRIVRDAVRCAGCLCCSFACVYEALIGVGREVTVRELLEEIEKDRVFYDSSQGGVTLSGGEPLAQPFFVEELLAELKSRSLHIAVDTSGFADFELLARIRGNVDLFLYDLKTLDDRRHREHTGVSNRLILENLKKLSGAGAPLWIRLPLVSGINDRDEDVRRALRFLRTLERIQQINLLPYHSGGTGKFARLHGRRSVRFTAPEPERIEWIKRRFEEQGFTVKLGG